MKSTRDVSVLSVDSSTNRRGAGYNQYDPTPDEEIVMKLSPVIVDEKFYKNQVSLYKKRFYWFALIASTNHALNYVVNAYSTTLLTHKLAGVTLGLNWTLNAVSGLTIATLAVRFLGFRNAMIVSFWGYSFQIASLYWAIIDPSIAWPVALLGSVVAGFTSAIWWSSQGVCFELTCHKIHENFGGHSDSINGSLNEIRSNLSANWTIIYQCADILVFLTLSIFPIFANISIHLVLLALTGLGIITAILGFTIDSLGDNGNVFDSSSLYSAVAAVPHHFATDCRATLLAPFVFGFGITTAMFAYYLNSAVISDSENLGPITLGLLEAYSYLVATIAAYPYAFVSNYFTGI